MLSRSMGNIKNIGKAIVSVVKIRHTCLFVLYFMFGISSKSVGGTLSLVGSPCITVI